MQAATQTAPVSKPNLWTGRIISALAVLFLLFDAIGHLTRPAPVVEAFARLDYPLSTSPGLGIIQLVCVAFYVIPQTSILGAILLTGYLGGAVASHVRIDDRMFDTLFPVIIGVLVWGGLYWRDRQLRALIPLRK
jgi:hypothetical protein